MGMFDKRKEPVFLKESGVAKEQLAALQQLRGQASGEVQKRIDQEIKIVEAGIYGEEQIIFELKNSHMPMAVLHDLYLEVEGFTAQIDFLIVTRGKIFVVECKNLIGNIEIDNAGNFTRILSNGKFYRREGIYSPITQNQRHMEVMKRFIVDARKNVLVRKISEHVFEDSYCSIVVLANPKTVLNAKYAKKEVKNQVIRADQLVNFIKKVNDGIVLSSEKQMMDTAEIWMKRGKKSPVDYLQKYREELEEEQKGEKQEQERQKAADEEQRILCPKCNAVMIKRVASKGANAGKEFYGCSRFPKCKGIVNIE